MPEKETASGFAALLPYLWMLFSVPITVIWRRLNGHAAQHDAIKDKLSDHKLYIAQNHFRKGEVTAIVRESLKPVQESCDRIEKKMDHLSERRERDRPGG